VGVVQKIASVQQLQSLYRNYKQLLESLEVQSKEEGPGFYTRPLGGGAVSDRLAEALRESYCANTLLGFKSSSTRLHPGSVLILCAFGLELYFLVSALSFVPRSLL
jgi:hypothetical protein